MPIGFFYNMKILILIPSITSYYTFLVEITNKLIKERNNVISKNLFGIMQNNKKLLAIIGAGHEEEVLDLIKDREAITYSFAIKHK